ncbi:hypothetical protein DE146DRAFT_681914 [Phaeosphaeria sp. MPI-PUGE-AT-0046c]|nr:hypothetical protein DE146DRAFT_681914 [Phaeosphaeria sp. MPI-PUGE-AT-0046c]
MDGEQPAAEQRTPMWSPEIALRSKKQVLLEDYKVPDSQAASLVSHKRQEGPFTANPTTFKPHDVTIFYQARSSPPIPSYEEIVKASAKNPLHADNGLHKEAESLLFLAENRPKLPIPTLLAAWSSKNEYGNVINFFMMNFIEGITLVDHREFAELSAHAQDAICAKVSSQIRYLRELPSEGYYGRPHGQGWFYPPPGLDTHTSASFTLVGPYKTYEEFCSAMYRSHQVSEAISTSDPEWHPAHQKDSAEIRSLLSSWEPHEPKFTWIDPALKNMIVRPIKGTDGSEDWEVFFIDWECAAWYPAWVQALQLDSRGEIVPMMLKDFDPEPDQKKMDRLHYLFWRFF